VVSVAPAYARPLRTIGAKPDGVLADGTRCPLWCPCDANRGPADGVARRLTWRVTVLLSADLRLGGFTQLVESQT
jgi:hypothetical protein